MINLKKIFVSSAIAISAISFAQGNITFANYPQSYESQNANNKESGADEKL